MSGHNSGRIITFYSYKGGSSRSMTLANIAWILASNGKRVLTLDWDLDAPGLHHYFAPFLIDKALTSSPGIIDLVWTYVSKAITSPEESEKNDVPWFKSMADIRHYAIRLEWSFPQNGFIDFVPAGRQGTSYAKQVNSFNWQDFYERFSGGAFLESVKDEMRKEYDYILIDSRTGVTDTSGICTVQMPDVLAILFTPNNQNIQGAIAVAESVDKQWRSSKDTARIQPAIFPILARTDRAEFEKLALVRNYARAKFASLLRNMTPTEQAIYWGNVEIPYVTYYAFEEVLATFRDDPNQRESLLAAYEQLTSYLTDGEISELVPPHEGEREEVLAQFTRRPLSISDHFETDFLIITALEKEAGAVTSLLKQHSITRSEDRDIRTYHYGTIPLRGTDDQYLVAVLTLPRMGTVSVANAMTNAIARWNPRFIVVLGIAGGIPLQGDLDLGDVVVADQVVSYEYGKADDQDIKPRDRVYPASALLLDRIRNFWDDSWTKQGKVARPTNAKRQASKQFVGLIAAGNKVVASTEFRMQLIKHWPMLLAVETESEGVFADVFDRPQIAGALVIRGICDMADERKSDGWQEYAANIAAAFTVSFLQSGPVTPVKQEDLGRLQDRTKRE